MSNIVKILSFDCGHKSLGYAYVFYKLDWVNTISLLLDKAILHCKTTKGKLDINVLYEIFDSMIVAAESSIKVIKMGYLDVLPGSKLVDTNAEYRAVQTKKHLKALNDDLFGDVGVPDYVLIEYQMSANDKSREISHQIMYEYANYHPISVGPSYKNKLIADESGAHSNFLSKASNNYSANKKHAKYTFAAYTKLFNIRVDDIPARHYADVSDSFCQILGFMCFCKTNIIMREFLK
jgi:hypothetical protein